MNQLILGDCLEALKKIEAESIDLIYLDPPFFSNRNYEMLWGDEGEIRSFQDRWSGGIDHYIAWLKERVAEMHRVLKATGSIFLHCDWHANAYIRVYILDKIFGEQNFRSEITWKRSSAHNDAKQGRKALGNITDKIFYYTKSDKYIFNQQYTPYNDEYISTYYKYIEEGTGRKYWLDNLQGPGGKSKGNPKYEVMGITRYWRYSKENMIKLIEEGRVIQTKPGTVPKYKRYLDEMPGKAVQDLWDDIKGMGEFSGKSKERIGYPTQKPEKLLERIIAMASNKDDTVLDPFVGGGTTVAVAERLNRNWIGIDQSVSAIKITEMRLDRERTLFSKPFTLQLHKYDYDTLRYKDAFDFETWIIGQYSGTANTKQKSDFGTDGKTKDGKPLQVKRSDNIGRNVIDNFLSACKRYDKKLFEKSRNTNESVGVIIAFSFGKGAVQETARLKNEENIIIELVRVDEIVPIAKKPVLTVVFNDLGTDKKDMRDIEFTAKGESESGIEFYAWDWDYNEEKGIFKPEILRDREGKQVHKFKAGIYCIAVKAVDNDGLESTEIIKLKVNGKIEKEEKKKPVYYE